MSAIFPSMDWLNELEKKLNGDERYAGIAKNWEGDMTIVVEPDGNLKERMIYYLDLWHGKCRSVAMLQDPAEKDAAFLLTATYENIKRIMTGKLDPMQAMLTRKLSVKGNMAVMMRSVPTVLDFVRCCREITTEIL
ncbi:MAG: SCP2 sterol-binding domain-containing protein [Anaerolineales bacterium]|nr:MAG: SCP2 sterol-binding domain-containing protein [Anaerolineales bacterium]